MDPKTKRFFFVVVDLALWGKNLGKLTFSKARSVSSSIVHYIHFFFVQVTRSKQNYLQDVEAREEAGTCNIVGAIRAGLTFQIKAVSQMRDWHAQFSSMNKCTHVFQTLFKRQFLMIA